MRPLLELRIFFQSDALSWWDGCQELTLKDNQFELAYAPFLYHKTAFNGRCHSRTFDVHYSKGYLQAICTRIILCFLLFLEKVEKGQPAQLIESPQFLSPAMISIIHDILHYDMHESTAPYFYEASVLLLLTMVLDRLNNQMGVKQKPYSAADIERVTEAKNIILSDVSEKYTIPELAKKIGINEWKLQHCFKEVFGTTVFNYSQSARLEYAKLLLINSKDSVQSIAEQCGYPDNSNLTAAFKKSLVALPIFTATR